MAVASTELELGGFGFFLFSSFFSWLEKLLR